MVSDERKSIRTELLVTTFAIVLSALAQGVYSYFQLSYTIAAEGEKERAQRAEESKSQALEFSEHTERQSKLLQAKFEQQFALMREKLGAESEFQEREILRTEAVERVSQKQEMYRACIGNSEVMRREKTSRYSELEIAKSNWDRASFFLGRRYLIRQAVLSMAESDKVIEEGLERRLELLTDFMISTKRFKGSLIRLVPFFSGNVQSVVKRLSAKISEIDLPSMLRVDEVRFSKEGRVEIESLEGIIPELNKLFIQEDRDLAEIGGIFDELLISMANEIAKEGAECAGVFK